MDNEVKMRGDGYKNHDIILAWPGLSGAEKKVSDDSKGSKQHKKLGGARQQPASKAKGAEKTKLERDKPKGKGVKRANQGSQSFLARQRLLKEEGGDHGTHLPTDTDTANVVRGSNPEEGSEKGSQDLRKPALL